MCGIFLSIILCIITIAIRITSLDIVIAIRRTGFSMTCNLKLLHML